MVASRHALVLACAPCELGVRSVRENAQMGLVTVFGLLAALGLALWLGIFWIFPISLCALLVAGAIFAKMPEASYGADEDPSRDEGLTFGRARRGSAAYARENRIFLGLALVFGFTSLAVAFVGNEVTSATFATVATFAGAIWYSRR